MNITVIGARGMLGHDLCNLLAEQNLSFTPLDIDEIDITDKTSVSSVLPKTNSDIIINCAAYTNVEKAEDEAELALKVNQAGPKNLAEFSSNSGTILCHISTDYVFDGRQRVPYREQDPVSPLGVYGKSKLAGENEIRKIEKHFIIRTAWLYGKNGKNFITTIINAARERDELKVVNDQFGSPTYTVDLSKRILEIVTKLPFGTYHATNSGSTSWYKLTKEIFEIKEIATQLTPIPSEKYPCKVKRPKYSILSNEKCIAAGLQPMPSWQDALKRFLSTI